MTDTVERMIWAPRIADKIKDEGALTLYLQLACTPCIPGGGCSVDKAMQILCEADGDIKIATERLLNTLSLQQTHAHDDQTPSAVWTDTEIQMFEELIVVHKKNFFHISRAIKTKTVKQCVEFYYLWKRSPMRSTFTYLTPAASSDRASLSSPNSSASSSNHSSPLVVDDFHPFDWFECSRLQQQQLQHQQHMLQQQQQHQQQQQIQLQNHSMPLGDDEQFPCKVCGRVFAKIKSRSAHMKRHKNGR